MKKWRKPVTASEAMQDTHTFKDVFSGLLKGERGNIDSAIALTPDCLNAMFLGDKLVVRDEIDVQHPGEYTEWSFKKCSDYKFITTRRERVYTGAGRTGYEIQTFGEGTWTAGSVAQQVLYNPAKVVSYSVYADGEYDTTTFFTRS